MGGSEVLEGEKMKGLQKRESRQVLADGCEGCKCGAVSPILPPVCLLSLLKFGPMTIQWIRTVSLAPSLYHLASRCQGVYKVQMPPVGLEPTTLKLRGLRSIQLNYGGTWRNSTYIVEQMQ